MAIRNHLSSCVLMALLGLMLAGCAREARQYTISGTVKYQGQPIADGQIIFTDDDGSHPWPGKIKDGSYTMQATAGPKIVRITASKETGRMLDGAMDTKIPERIDLIPPQYNSASQEKRTIEAKQPQVIDFDLK